ncbi:hypothetical protein ALC53_06257 [Atta colombica]|uniref:Uncharacterized protein n=1 Tax=Atta colombica TaxID=520822 RepID=A0A195BFN4_9HYME|nr:hypothetical protein ALC53_06257 [Atta colombica]
MPSRRRTKLRDAVLHSEATCPKVKSTIETDSDDISVVTAHTHVFAFRVRIPIFLSMLFAAISCGMHAERSGGPNAQSFRPLRFERTFRMTERTSLHRGKRKLAPFGSQVQNAPGLSRSP